VTAGAAAVLAELPSPTQGVWYLGPFPLRAYALCIIAGIVLAVWLGNKRYVARGGQDGIVLDVAAWAVPFGIVGGRLYHVATNPELYFASGRRPIEALYIWHGGLGIWGAIALGAVGAYIGARRRGVLMPPVADALAPGVLAAQALGRWGNWFNNELYGGSTNLPWGLKIYEWDQGAGRAVVENGAPLVRAGSPFHPTFLYESLWSAAGVVILLWADRRFRLGHGRVFALYVAVYTSGRLWIEALRVDDANTILGLRLNIWTSAIVLLGSLVAFVLVSRRRPGREGVVTRPRPAPRSPWAADGATGETKATTPAEDADDATTDGDEGGSPEKKAPEGQDAAEVAADGVTSRSATA
jgi:prolipoprotein diacylglyceryl transferase